MSKRNILIMVLVIIIVLSIYMLYNSFASYSTIGNGNGTYIITLNEDNSSIIISANSSKTIYYHIKNTNRGTVRYGVGYNSDSNVSVMVYSDSMDKGSGLIDYGGNKYIKLYLSNTSDSDSTLVLSTILGYENGGDLIVPDGIVLVSEEYMSSGDDLAYNTLVNLGLVVVIVGFQVMILLG